MKLATMQKKRHTVNKIFIHLFAKGNVTKLFINVSLTPIVEGRPT